MNCHICLPPCHFKPMCCHMTKRIHFEVSANGDTVCAFQVFWSHMMRDYWYEKLVEMGLEWQNWNVCVTLLNCTVLLDCVVYHLDCGFLGWSFFTRWKHAVFEPSSKGLYGQEERWYWKHGLTCRPAQSRAGKTWLQRTVKDSKVSLLLDSLRTSSRSC